MATKLKPIRPELEQYVRFYISTIETSSSVLSLRDGKSPQELAETAATSGTVAFETFDRITAIVRHPEINITVRLTSDEFNFSPRYYINGQLVPVSEVPETTRYTNSEFTRFWVQTRFGTFEAEDREPEFIIVKSRIDLTNPRLSKL